MFTDNHPPSILKNIPQDINRRLSKMSSSEDAFISSAEPYQQTLDKSGYDLKLYFEQEAPKPKNRSRKR